MNVVPVAYLASTLLSLLGNSIAGVALPLVVLQVTGSALGAGTVAAATALPAVAAGLLMGVVIDRVNRRTASVVTDLVSAASVAALPVIDMVAGLDIGWFVLCGVVGSLGDVPGMTARDALLPAVVRHGRLEAERLLGLRESLSALALLLGPAAAGTLMVLLDGSAVLWVTAATSAAAALLTLLIPREVGAVRTAAGDPGAEAAAGGWAQLREGWRALGRSRFLLAVTTLSVVAGLVLAALQGLVLPVWFTLVDRPGMLGFVLSALAAGMLLGGGVYAAVGTRGRRRVWFLVGLAGSTAGFAVVVSLASVGAVLVGAFVVGVSNGLFGALLGVLMVERVPDRMRGRIMGTQNAVLTAAAPLGIVVAALLVEGWGVEVAAIGLGAVWLVALVVGVSARSLRRLEPDDAGEGSEPGTQGSTDDGTDDGGGRVRDDAGHERLVRGA
ncbi:MFS transporter [Isoptericola sp. NPDC019693]|uniref:MFS transporter n=1 Tax=Isoptericola sp. NPDC019693 TaxID=3364009 RepID=UPI003787EB4D